jgi:hypothetical protein
MSTLRAFAIGVALLASTSQAALPEGATCEPTPTPAYKSRPAYLWLGYANDTILGYCDPGIGCVAYGSRWYYVRVQALHRYSVN